MIRQFFFIMKANKNSFIGVFDSGIGGLTLLPVIQSIAPNENILYVSDDAHAPYGCKEKIEIIDRCKTIVDYLVKKECKLILVACNTATTSAIKILRATYSVTFIGIEPAIKPAVLKSKTRIIGVLATQGTLSSSLFSKTSETLSNEVRIIEQNGTGLVEFIETGNMDNPRLIALLSTSIKPMLDQNIDTLVLGCTHYPFLIPLLKKMMPDNIQIIDNSEAVAKQVVKILKINKILNSYKEKGTIKYTSSSKKSSLLNFLPEGTKISMLPIDQI